MKTERRKMDARLIKTYRKLVDGMTSLLESEKPESISVINICEVSGVHRATFYKHFDEKSAFHKFYFESLVKEMIGDVIPRTKAEAKAMAKAKAETNSVQSAGNLVNAIFEFASEHKQLVLNITDTTTPQVFLSLFTDAVSKAFESILMDEKDESERKDAAMLADFYAGAVTGMLRRWANENERYTSEQVIGFAKRKIEKDSCISEIER